MTPGFNLKLSVTPEGLRKLVRKNVHKKGFFHLKLHKDPESEKWTTETEWTPIHDLKGDSPEELLRRFHSVRRLIAVDASVLS